MPLPYGSIRLQSSVAKVRYSQTYNANANPNPNFRYDRLAIADLGYNGPWLAG